MTPAEIGRRLLGRWSGRVHSLPVLVLMPHSRCNCRCLMCDIWRANKNRREIDAETLSAHLEALRSLRVRWVVLSGGEPLMHGDLWTLCRLLRGLELRLTLLSTGLLLERYATEVTAHCDDVIVSLDGDPETHDRIRRTSRAFERLAAGVEALREAEADFRVTGRCVVQRENFRRLDEIVSAARGLGLDQLSFLAADVSSEAFNRPQPWGEERVAEVALEREELSELEEVVERLIERRRAEIESGFVAESAQRLREIVAHFRALLGLAEFPPRRCNAPWVSAVVEADGEVRPCFFHRSYGNLSAGSLETVINSREAIAFRRRLDVSSDPICRRCVCTLQLPATAKVG